MNAPFAAIRAVNASFTAVWRCERPWLAISSAPLGGGLGERHWVINATVPLGYARLDPDAHLAEIADGFGLTGAGVGMLTAVDVRDVVHESDGGVRVSVTTGIGGYPTWAAAPDSAAKRVGTINAVCWLPVRLSDAALVNAVATVAEAKAQAMYETGVPGRAPPPTRPCCSARSMGRRNGSAGRGRRSGRRWQGRYGRLSLRGSGRALSITRTCGNRCAR
jgi:adenosylcobinamide amidohydrolase